MLCCKRSYAPGRKERLKVILNCRTVDGAKLFALFYKRKGVIIMTDFEMISIFMMILSLVTTLVMIKKDK